MDRLSVENPFLFGAFMTAIACGLLFIKSLSAVVTFFLADVDDVGKEERRQFEEALDGVVQIMLFIVAYNFFGALPSVLAIGLIAADVCCKAYARPAA